MTTLTIDVAASRESLAATYLRGSGIEIGALDTPYPVDPARLSVRYVDRFARADLLRHYPELTDRAALIVDPDIVEDGETLACLADASQDFVIASHFLEHCENPLATLASHHRVLRAGGHLLLAVPNTANPTSWDYGRPLTSFGHVINDDVQGPQVSRDQHYQEWVTFAGKMTGEAASAEKAKLLAMKYSIHFHCWTADTFPPFLDQTFSYKKLRFQRVASYANDYEIAVVLRKT